MAGGEHLIDPIDPRLESLPQRSTLPTITRLDPYVWRVLAPNPSPMALDGTNTYIVSEPGAGDAVVVDPGPSSPEHLERILNVLASIDAECSMILVTHHHIDHSESARLLGERLRCVVGARDPGVAGPKGELLADGVVGRSGGVTVSAVGTPGHCADHVAFRLAHGPLLTGDHILGRGTSVIAAPDGDLAAYLESLRRVLHLGPDALFPGHGPEMRESIEGIVRYYIDHRAFRERQILLYLSGGRMAIGELTRRIYPDLDEALLQYAEMSTMAALTKLSDEARVQVEGGYARCT